MGTIHPTEPAKLIVGMLSACTGGFDAARDELARHYGTIDIESAAIPAGVAHLLQAPELR